jgi:hypothetical protein
MSNEVTPAIEDEGILESISDAVETVLSDDFAPADPEDPWERRQRLLDSWTAVILAIAAVATAWASFQASQWSGAQSDRQSESAILRADAGRAQTAATADTVIDSQTWLSWVSAVDAKQEAKAKFLSARFSPTLKVAQAEWLSGVKLDAQGVPVYIPPGTPLGLPSYRLPKQIESDTKSDQAEAKLAEADVAAGNSTEFVLVALLFALVLFFASIATKFSAPRVQVLLMVISIGLLAIGLIRMFLITPLL